MKKSTTQRLHRWHYWSGLISGVNLIILSLTGSILVFHHELEEWLYPRPVVEHTITTAAEIPPIQLDPIIAEYTQKYPDFHLASVGLATAERKQHLLNMVPTETALAAAEAAGETMQESNPVINDPITAEAEPEESHEDNLIHIIYHLHVDLFAGRAGLLFLGVISLIFILSAVSGYIIYGPFMKQLAFGMIRPGSLNLAATDIHKMVGAITLGFQLLMAVTGLFLTLGGFVLQIYIYFELKSLPPRPEPVIQTVGTQSAAGQLASLDQGLANARAHFAADPDEKPEQPTFLTAALYPGGLQGDDYFVVLGETETGIDRFVPKPLLMDRETGAVAHRLRLPWYIQMIALSQPFHFGNFGGLTIKLIWFVFGLGLSGLALSGVWLHVKRIERARGNAATRRGTMTALVATSALFLWLFRLGYLEFLAWGPLIDGKRVMPDVAPGVAIFIGIWVVITTVILALFIFMLGRAVTRSRHSQAREVTVTEPIFE